MHGGSGELLIVLRHCRCVEVLGRLGSVGGNFGFGTASGVGFGQCWSGILFLALLKNWWAAVKWQCLGVFLPVTLLGLCDLGSAERAFGNLYCSQSEIRAVQKDSFTICTARRVRFGQYRRTVLQFVLPAVCDSGSTGGRFCNLYCPWGVNRAVQRGVLHFVLPPAHDMSCTREENASSTA